MDDAHSIPGMPMGAMDLTKISALHAESMQVTLALAMDPDGTDLSHILLIHFEGIESVTKERSCGAVVIGIVGAAEMASTIIRGIREWEEITGQHWEDL